MAPRLTATREHLDHDHAGATAWLRSYSSPMRSTGAQGRPNFCKLKMTLWKRQAHIATSPLRRPQKLDPTSPLHFHSYRQPRLLQNTWWETGPTWVSKSCDFNAISVRALASTYVERKCVVIRQAKRARRLEYTAKQIVRSPWRSATRKPQKMQNWRSIPS